jgi:hypothetical protein
VFVDRVLADVGDQPGELALEMISVLALVTGRSEEYELPARFYFLLPWSRTFLHPRRLLSGQAIFLSEMR